MDSVTLSDRLRDSARTAEKITRDTMNQHIAAKTTVKRITDDLTRQSVSRGDLPKWLKEMEKAVLDGNADTIKIRRIMKNARTNLEKLAMADQPETRLKKAYSDVIKAVESGDSAAVAKKMERALKEKVAYNNQRIAVTESSNAYTMAFDRQIQDHPDFEDGHCYVRSTLSPRHSVPDECTYHAQVDLYGLGEGIYPYNDAPRIPYHPNCQCEPQIVVDFRDKRSVKFSEQRKNEYYAKLEPKRAEQIKKRVENNPPKNLKALPKDQVVKTEL
jgi:hypothetical protein